MKKSCNENSRENKFDSYGLDKISIKKNDNNSLLR
jgi:hypothetical protein